MLARFFQTSASGYLSTVLGIAAVTAIGAPFHDQLNNTTVALALVLVVLFIATVWGRGPGMLASVLGMLCFNFFFLPPLYTFTIADPQNWIALAVATRPVGTYAEKPLSVLSDPRVVKGLNRFVGFTSLFSVAVGVLGLVGWTFHIAILKSVIPGEIVIKPNTAVCFVLIGFSLWLLRKKDNQPLPRTRKLWGQLLATITALVGLLSLTEHLVGWDLGIDQLLFTETFSDAVGRVRPRLMSPIAALDFLLLGIALLLLDWPISCRSRRYWPAQLFAFLTGIIAFVGLLDFILESRISYTHIALQTAVTLFLLSFGLICARTEQGLGALFASSTVGGILTRRLLPAAVIIPMVIGTLAWKAYAAGLSSEWGSGALMTVAMMALLGSLTVWNGYIIDRSDSERRKAEGSLRRREEELREAQRLARVGSWWWDPKADSFTWSEGLYRIAGRDPKLPPPGYKEQSRFYTSESFSRLEAAVEKATQTGTPYELELEMVRADGAIRSVTSRGEVERDADGQVVLVRGTVQDVTERKQAESEIRLLARLQAVVADLGQRALRSDRYENVLDEAVTLVAEILDVDYCNVMEMLPGGEELLLRAGVGWKEGYVGRATVKSLDSQPGYTVRSGRPVIVEDAAKETRFVPLPLLLAESVVSSMSVVISTPEGPYGALGTHTRHRRMFSEDEANFLQAVANVLGSAIERHRSEARLRRINRAHRALSSCNEAVIRAADEFTLLQQICQIVVEEAGYRLCWVGHAENDEAKSVRPVAQAGLDEGYLKTLNITWADSERGRGPTGTCIRTRLTTLARDIATDPRMLPWRAEALKRGYASSIAIPLLVDSGVFGALMIYAAEREAFGAEEVTLLTDLANDLAFGIAALRTRTERARAEEEIRTLNAELEQRVSARTAELQAANNLKDELILREQAAAAELAQAREREAEIGFRIQQTLLLDEPPRDVPGLRVAALTVPSQRIDGDFYVFFKHPDQRLDIIVGDVMGKGVPAALLGAATKSHFIEALSHLTALSKNGQLPEPKEIVTLAHAEVARHLINLENFVTLCYARLDLNKRNLDLVDCGHTGIIHLHSKTGLCEMVHGDNLPLGIREGEIFNQISVPFEPGDLLLFYSDGVTEARNLAGELFGVDRLLSCVTTNSKLEPEALVEAIRKATVTFSESGRLIDDLTCVALKIEEPQLTLARAEIEIRSDLKELSRAREFVRTFCRHLPSPVNKDSVGALELAVNEAASNIMKHAYHGRTDQWIRLDAEAFPNQISFRLHHLGDPFDPSAVSPPALDGSQESGFGIYLITQSVDEVRYYRDERGRNCVALVKVHRS